MPHNRHLDKIQLLTSTAAIALTVVSFALLFAFSRNAPPTAATAPPSTPPPTEDVRLPTLPPAATPSAAPPAAGTALAAVGNLSPPNAPELDRLSREVQQMEDEFDALDRRLAALEETLVDEPGKAVELAVLRQELANLEARHELEIETLRAQTQRELDTLRGLTGLVIAGLLSGLVSVFIQARKNPPRGGAGEG
jgi:hypothetical protein